MSDIHSSPEWVKLKKQAYKRYGARCMCTGWTTEKHGVVLNVDHILPVSKYPRLALKLSNVQIICEAVNKTKSNRLIKDFRPFRWKLYYRIINLIKYISLFMAIIIGTLFIMPESARMSLLDNAVKLYKQKCDYDICHINSDDWEYSGRWELYFWAANRWPEFRERIK